MYFPLSVVVYVTQSGGAFVYSLQQATLPQYIFSSYLFHHGGLLSVLYTFCAEDIYIFSSYLFHHGGYFLCFIFYAEDIYRFSSYLIHQGGYFLCFIFFALRIYIYFWPPATPINIPPFYSQQLGRFYILAKFARK